MPGGETKEALVVYSLGNFISNQQKANTDGGIMFQVDLLKKKWDPNVTLGEYGVIPVWRYVQKPASGKSTYYAVPIGRVEANPTLIPGMTSSDRAKMQSFANSVRKRLDFKELK